MSKPPYLQDAEGLEKIIDNWVVPSRDSKGHYSRMWCNVPPQLKDVVNKIAGNNQLPYRSSSAVIRHALVRHIRWVANQCEDGIEHLKSVVVQMEAMADIMRDEDYNADFVMLFDKVQEGIQRYTGSGDFIQARLVLLRLRNKINKMPDCYWRQRYLKEFKQRFQYVMDRSAAAGHGNSIGNNK